jgi:hypothetical protein
VLGGLVSAYISIVSPDGPVISVAAAFEGVVGVARVTGKVVVVEEGVAVDRGPIKLQADIRNMKINKKHLRFMRLSLHERIGDVFNGWMAHHK